MKLSGLNIFSRIRKNTQLNLVLKSKALWCFGCYSWQVPWVTSCLLVLVNDLVRSLAHRTVLFSNPSCSMKNWFMPSVLISSYRCTREVWRALEKRKSRSSSPDSLGRHWFVTDAPQSLINSEINWILRRPCYSCFVSCAKIYVLVKAVVLLLTIKFSRLELFCYNESP